VQLIVENPSPQRVEFHYRVPGRQRIFVADIRVSQQVNLVPSNLSQWEADKVIEQLNRFGLIFSSAT
jgi:hypothetical protein